MNIRGRKNEKNEKSDQNENFDYEKQVENSRKDENDSLVNNLIQNIRNVKNYSLQIQNTLKTSNTTIEDMDKKYTESNSLMGDTMRRLGDVFSANSNYFCYLIIFMFVIFFFLYKITS